MSLGLILAAFAISSAPYAAAYSYGPPWASWGLGGPYTYVRLEAFYNVYRFDDASSGVAHTDTDSWVWLQPTIGLGDASVITFASFNTNTFTGPSNDYYNVYWNWKLSGNAELDNYITPFGSATVTTWVGIWFIGWICDTDRGVCTYAPQFTVLSESLTALVLVKNWNFNNFYYQQSTDSSPFALYAGHHYIIGAQLKTYDEANVGGVAAAGFAFGHVNLTATFYQTSYTLWTGGGCVLSGTPILTHGNETLKVDNIKPGQTVLGWSVSQGRFVNESVTSNTASFVSQVESINDGQLVLTVDDQPMYVRNGTWQGWVHNPSTLVAGEQLFQPATGHWLNITSVQAITGKFKVYDLRTTSPGDFIANGLLAGDK